MPTEPNGSTPKIGKPLRDLPLAAAKYSRYDAIWKALDQVDDDGWLPVTFGDTATAKRFQITAATHRSRKCQTRMTGTTVFIRKWVTP